MIEKLMDHELFQDLPIQDLEQIAAFSQLIEYEDGDILMSENTEVNYDIFLLLSGSVEIVTRSAPAVSAEVVISSAEKDILGELSWLLKQKRSATVRSLSDSVVIKIQGDRLSAYFEQHPETGYHFMKKIAELLALRLQSTDDLLKQVLWNI